MMMLQTQTNKFNKYKSIPKSDLLATFIPTWEEIKFIQSTKLSSNKFSRDLKDMMNEPTFSKRNSEKAIEKSKSMIAPTNKSSSGETEKMTKNQSLIEQDKVSLKKVDKLEAPAKVDLININFSEGGEFAKEIKNQTLNIEN